MKRFITSPLLLAFIAGACAVFGFAPFGIFPLPVLALALLFWLWSQAQRPAHAAWIGFAFGMGLFCVGVSWIYVALHEYGYMHPILAAVATALFAAVNATLPALAGYVQAKFRANCSLASNQLLPPSRGGERSEGAAGMGVDSPGCNTSTPTLTLPLQGGGDELAFDHSGVSAAYGVLLIMPAIWTLAEWIRGFLFTGFPWLSLGYSQVPNSPLAGYAPVFGVFGVSLMLALSAGLLVLVVQRTLPSHFKGESGLGNKSRKQVRYFPALALLVIWIVGAALSTVEWTHPQGDPLKVSLLQGNIAQNEKFAEGSLSGTLETYRRLAQSSDARLVVLPETALPILRDNVPQHYQNILSDHLRKSGGDILIGAFEKDNGNYYNSVYSLGTSESQHYRKDHLVPFGEFIPLRGLLGWFINDVLSIPMGDLASGGATQKPLNVAGQKVAVDICYEDAFGEEIIRALPEATLLVNVTNDAWYGDSHAAMQHNQLSQMRALESGRMMLRATNTGVTSVIGVDGHIQAMLPQHQQGVLTVQVQGYIGSTPYVRWGNTAMLVLITLMLVTAWWLQRTPSPSGGGLASPERDEGGRGNSRGKCV